MVVGTRKNLALPASATDPREKDKEEGREAGDEGGEENSDVDFDVADERRIKEEDRHAGGKGKQGPRA
ncbi:hypothetical protein MD484_g8989, partial [Candolleomyces efflorescens]